MGAKQVRIKRFGRNICQDGAIWTKNVSGSSDFGKKCVRMKPLGRKMFEDKAIWVKNVSGYNDLGEKIARPCAQGVLDPLIVPCPMSLGCAVLIVLLFDSKIMHS